MSDIRAGEGFGPEDEDHLPWLEPVEEEDERRGPSLLKMIVAILIGLIIIGLVVTGVYWLRSRDQAPAGPQLIEAEKGDYKVKPSDPGGLKVTEQSGETALAASEGAQPSGKLNMDAVPEAPVTRPPVTRPAPAPKAPTPVAPPPKAEVASPPAPKPEPAPTAAGQTIQLGAFASGAIANDAWKGLSTRFKYLEPLAHSVTVATVNGKTYYRLRASGPDAKELCGRLRVAGENCISVD